MKYKSWQAAAALAALLGAAASQAAVTGFSGSWAPDTWTTSIVGSVNGGFSGSVDSSGAPNAIVLAGGNDASDTVGCLGGFGGCELRFTHSAMADVPIAFSWAYVSSDAAGAQLDVFGLLLSNGTHLQLSDPGGASAQSGSYRFLPATSGAVGFYINCGDCLGGNAQVTISGLQVPEPASLALVGLGLFGIGALRRQPPA